MHTATLNGPLPKIAAGLCLLAGAVLLTAYTPAWPGTNPRTEVHRASFGLQDADVVVGECVEVDEASSASVCLTGNGKFTTPVYETDNGYSSVLVRRLYCTYEDGTNITLTDILKLCVFYIEDGTATITETAACVEWDNLDDDTANYVSVVTSTTTPVTIPLAEFGLGLIVNSFTDDDTSSWQGRCTVEYSGVE